MELKLGSPQDCIGDFTYNFIWQHKGAELEPTGTIPSQVGTSYTYEAVVGALKRGEEVHIRGDVGKRVGSSLGVDLVFFGGSGKELPRVGSIFVDGNAGSHLGLSMLAGSIYVKGKVAEPLGNVVQVESNLEGYKKFVSITWLLHHPEDRDKCILLEPNEFHEGELLLADGKIRNTIAARCRKEVLVRVRGNAGISAGILMRTGLLVIEGNADMNAAVLLNGGTVVVLGDAAEFLGVEMRRGVAFVKGRVKGYVGARMSGGRIICRKTKPIPPVRETKLEKADSGLLARYGVSGMFALSYGRYEL